MKLILCEWILGIIVFFTGTCIFSFLNVIIYRVPRKMSFVREFSMCPACGHPAEHGGFNTGVQLCASEGSLPLL